MKSKNTALLILSLFAVTLASCAGQNRGYCGPMSRHPVPQQRYAAPCPQPAGYPAPCPTGYAQGYTNGHAQPGRVVQTGTQVRTFDGPTTQHTVQGPTRTSDGQLLSVEAKDILIQRNSETGEIRHVVAQKRNLTPAQAAEEMEQKGVNPFPSTIKLGPNGWVFPDDKKSPVVRTSATINRREQEEEPVLPPQ